MFFALCFGVANIFTVKRLCLCTLFEFEGHSHFLLRDCVPALCFGSGFWIHFTVKGLRLCTLFWSWYFCAFKGLCICTLLEGLAICLVKGLCLCMTPLQKDPKQLSTKKEDYKMHQKMKLET